LLITLPRKGKEPKKAVKQRAKLDYKYSYNGDFCAIEAKTLKTSVLSFKMYQRFFSAKNALAKRLSPFRLRRFSLFLLQEESLTQRHQNRGAILFPQFLKDVVVEITYQ